MSYTRTCPDCGQTRPVGRFPRKGRRCRQCAAEVTRRRRRPAAERDARLRREYGIDSAEYRRMGRSQQWRCAICDRRPYPEGSRLVVDHDHSTGAVRALLCAPCNSALGLMGDKPDRLDAAARYLRKQTGP